MRHFESEAFSVVFEQPPRVSDLQYTIIGPSRLTRRFDPLVSVHVSLPKQLDESVSRLVFNPEPILAKGASRRRAQLLRMISKPEHLPGIWLNLRPYGLSNWSHALNQAVPLALMARKEINDRRGEGLSVIVSADTSPKIIGFLQQLGFQCHVSDADVVAIQVRLEGSVRIFSREWLTPHVAEIRRIIVGRRIEVPEKLFVDRRRGRHLLNGVEVREFLGQRGYQVVYPEDFSLEDQMDLFIRARAIVAIHGAGLAPLQYRIPEDGELQLVEIMSPGHMTGFFRGIVRGLPVDYRAVRGNPSRKMLRDDLLRDPRLFAKRHSLSAFNLDIEALDLALHDLPIEEILKLGLPT